jgi:hypothetical protein
MDNLGFPITIVQGDDFYFPITYSDQYGNPINLSGYSAEMQVRGTVNSNNPPLIDVSTANGYIVIVPATGAVNITIPHSMTVSLPSNSNAVYDVVITSVVGFQTRIIFGNVYIPERVTR